MTLRGFDVDLSFAKYLNLPTDGLWTVKRGTKSFRCLLPGKDHEDKRPSASLFRTDSGDIIYRDWHGQERWYTLPEVYASLAYGVPKKFRRGSTEHAVWHCRLLYETGAVKPVPVPHRVLQPDATPAIRKVYEGFILHVGLRWLRWPRTPVTFAGLFGAAWCQVSERAVRESMPWLIREKYIAGVGSVPSRFKKQTWLLCPVLPETKEGVRGKPEASHVNS
jgi:hypothetical protein